MKKYIIKSVSKATDENRCFAGEVLVSYTGKGGFNLGFEGSHAERNHIAKPLADWLLDEYGYERKSDAVRSYAYKYPENTKWWKTEVEILEVTA